MTCVDDPRIHAGFPPIPVWSRFELDAATTAIRALPRRDVYLEIGSYRGGTAWHFAHAALEVGAQIICVDFPGGPGGRAESYGSLLKTRDRLREDGFQVRVVRQKSAEAIEAVREILAGRTVNVLVIDGDHGPGAALADWTLYSPLLDGLAIFHDCGVVDHRASWSQWQMEFMTHTRAGFLSAAAGRRFLTIQEDFGTGLIWTSA